MTNFKVFVAGTSGAGKTAILASIYNRLCTESPEVGFYLETSGEASNILVSKYNDLTNPETPWPAGTANISKWQFKCKSRVNQQTLFNFSYLDFPGGFISDAVGNQQAEAFDITRKISDANSLLFLLDGQKIHYFMTGKELATGRPITVDINFLAALASRAQVGVPLHFVVTKWDILEGQFSLVEIKEKLLGIPQFNQLVQSRRAEELPTRLIPVSAFGKDFATLDDSGRMIKHHLKLPPSPFQVELPMACTLIDGFRVAHKQAVQNKLEADNSKMMLVSSFLKFVTLMVNILGFGAKQVNFALPPAYQFGTKACEILLASASRNFVLKSNELDREINRIMESLENKESSIETVIKKFDLLALKLEQDYPGSNLTSQ